MRNLHCAFKDGYLVVNHVMNGVNNVVASDTDVSRRTFVLL